MGYRLPLIKNSRITKPKPEKIVLVSSLKELQEAVKGKYRISLKKLRLFVRTNCLNLPNGAEIKTEDDFQRLHDDTLIAVSKGEDYLGPQKKKMGSTEKLTPPPGHPSLGLSQPTPPSLEETTLPVSAPLTPAEPPSETMNGRFPVLEGNLVPALQKLAEKYPLISLEERPGGYLVADYRGQIDYPPITDWSSALLRECRGLILSSQTGQVLARRFHKFFNLNQIPETNQQHLPPLAPEDRISRKIDGSLVSPIRLDSGEIIWATRKTEQLELTRWLQETPLPQLPTWVEAILDRGITPLFEWCTPRRDVGVLHYEQPQLTLLAMRENHSGAYLPLPDEESLPGPRVQTLPTSPSWEGLLVDLQHQIDQEGVVVQTTGGEWYKVKTPWYVQMVQASKYGGQDRFLIEWLSRNPDLKPVPAKKIWALAFSPPDDLIAHLNTLLPPEQREPLFEFLSRVSQQIPVLVTQLSEWVFDLWGQLSDAEPIGAWAEQVGWPNWLVPDLLARQEITEKLKKFLTQLARDPQVPVTTLEDLLQVIWNGPNLRCQEWVRLEYDLGKCQTASPEVQEHLLENYLSAKVSRYLGLPEITPETTLQIPRNYRPDEGKIKGLWEKFAEKENLWDLRIDLQPCRRAGYTAHEGSPDYALLLVQYGLKGDKKDLPHGSFGGILIPTNYEAPFSQLQQGLQLSLQSQTIVRLPRKAVSKQAYQLYCDLDGVLADFEKGLQKLPTYRSSDPPAKMWPKILQSPGFFQHLEWMPGAEEMWAEMVELNQQPPTILSGIPYQSKKQVAREKKNWCQKHLGEEVPVICDRTQDKYRYSGPRKVLIDDRYDTIQAWRSHYGGIGIHHLTPARTQYELRRLFQKLPALEFPDPPLELPPYELTQEIIMITDRMPKITEAMIGIDVEWDHTQSGASLVQIATSKTVYLLDLWHGSPLLKEALRELLQDPRIIKLGFAFGGDQHRLGSDLISVVDLQEVAIDQIPPFHQHQVPSLERLTARVLQKQLSKTKEFQTHSWNQRPLTEEQEHYAACDAAVLLELASRLPEIPPKNLIQTRLQKTQTATQSKSHDFDPSLPVKVLFQGLFLTPESQTELTQQVPQKLPQRYADHLILRELPTERELRGVPIGNTFEVQVTHQHLDTRIQALRVTFQGETYPLTLSTQHGVPPTESQEITEWTELEKPFFLRGMMGVRVMAEENPLALLPVRIQDKIQDLLSQEPGARLKFKTQELSASERAVIHDFASTHGLESHSSGRKQQRRLQLTKLRKEVAPEVHLQSHKITDPFLFALLKITTSNAYLPTMGSLTPEGIDWGEPKSWTPMTLILLRGLPGSGKSFLAQELARILKAPIVSADSYFQTPEGYRFQASQLSKAHTECQKQAREFLERGEEYLIVDNTNSRKSEYQVYRQLAQEYEYHFEILEINCIDKDEAQRFAYRNQHQVPYRDILKMLTRWESDDEAQLIMAYHPETQESKSNSTSNHFQHWLAEKKWCHFNKQRGGRYLSMGVGSRPHIFVDVPDDSLDDFFEHYTASGVTEAGEPKYLLQLMGPEVQMFFDADYYDDHPLPPAQLHRIAQEASELLGSRIVVLGKQGIVNGQVKTGFHLYSQTRVSAGQCLEYREALITRLQEWKPEKNWASIIDADVYRSGNGLRLYGSRKSTKFVDQRRIYTLWGVWEHSWTTPEWDDLTILQETILRPRN